MTTALTPRLRTASLQDYPRIRGLEARHLPATLSEASWLGLFLDNPLWSRLGASWPVGWVFENTDGELVGSIGNVPSLYRFRGEEYVCANGRSWVIEPEYRAYALMLMDEYYQQPGAQLFVNTTVGPDGAATADMFATRIPLGDWQSYAIAITRYRPFARRALEKKGVPGAAPLSLPAAAALWCADALRSLPPVPPSVEVTRLERFDARFDAFWSELVRTRPDTLLAVRDERTLNWHYAEPLRAGQVRILTATRAGLLRGYCVLRLRTLPDGLRCLRLIDYRSLEQDVDLLPALLRAALRTARQENLHIVEHLGRGLPGMRAFDEFARYRFPRQCWAYYYRTPDPVLAEALSGVRAWDPSEYDGDASLY
ncbi:MAG TPA: hypothetical protein VGM60_07425 [Pseudonocardia sp.]|uniref:hypothetical protein n=1 Tax=Pseudonocardia sp. TaxID=60912 RepID=UPI002F422965